jgi:putative DNA primase/helicase
VVFDEAESEDRASQLRFDRVLELARQASTETGAGIVKGTQNGGSVTYLIRSMFLFASIGVAAVKKADTSRVTVLPLRKNTGPEAASHFERVKTLWRQSAASEAYCEAVRKRSLNQARTIRTNCETFSTVAVEFTGDKRSADQIGTLLAGAFSLTSQREIERADAWEWMAKQDWTGFRSEDVDSDENQCLAHLLASQISFDLLGGNVRRSVGEVIEWLSNHKAHLALENDARRYEDMVAALGRHGLKFAPGTLTVANRHPALEVVFRETPWAGAKWNQQLARVTGAAKTDGAIRFQGGEVHRAVEIPIRGEFQADLI